MTSPTSGQRRRRDDSETDEASSDLPSQDTPGTPKRRRLRLDSSPSEQRENNSRPSTTRASTTQPDLEDASMDDFHPGAIRRVTVENFVTYEKAEFLPGPHLNMVIGPNGTGKSSLVCAICLGLAYSPKHLGRAGSVKEFVKHGCDTATIEIELQKRPQDRANYVIKVLIRREQNSQKWWINKKETTQKAVQSLMQTLKIQVDNLCQFLPQDRVVEFAACTPVDLLHETLRAAAPVEMLQWQKQLQELHREKKQMAQTVKADRETLANLESRQQGLQADVDRVREREEILERVENLRGALVLAQYEDARSKHSEAKARKQEAERTLRRLEHDAGPSLEAVNQKQKYAAKVEGALSAKERSLTEVEKSASSAAQKAKSAADKVQEMDKVIESERRRFNNKKKELAEIRSKITRLQGSLKNKPVDFNAADWNQKIRAEEHILRDLETDHDGAIAESQTIRSKGVAQKARIQQVERDIQALNTQEGQQLSFLKKKFPEVATAWEWVQNHQNEFEKEVFGPSMMTCSIKDERYTDQVQALLQLDDFLCITAQTPKDHRKLTDQFYHKLSLSVTVRTCPHALDSYQRPVSQEEASAYGLDGFVIDFLDGPAPCLAMLCAVKKIHQTGVTLREHSDDEYEKLAQSVKISQWIAGRHSYVIRRRREYGPQAMTAITKNLRPGRFWTTRPAATQERAELDRRLTELKGEREVLKGEYEKSIARATKMKDDKEEIIQKINKLRSEKSELQREYQKWQSLPNKIETEESSKALREQELRDIRESVVQHHFDWDDAATERMQLILKHTKLIEQIREAQEALLELHIQQIEARSDERGLKLRNADLMQRLEQERHALQQATAETSRAREAGKKLSLKARKILAQQSAATAQLWTELSAGKTPDNMDMEISAEEAKLELIFAANPNVMREFERRAQEIESLQRKMEEMVGKLEGLDGRVEELMARWEPGLDELVVKINDAFAYNFEQISCAGEVRVRKEENFDQWALDAMVKFRENEALQKLTAHRQSGGERAVSTIFYLMALQSLAQSPFRVVDEINQGMDPRNERMVHDRMVEIACREHTSQYFLITPKLLTGLRYDPRMRVLCIASGERMPREGKRLDFRRCLERQRRIAAAQVACYFSIL